MMVELLSNPMLVKRLYGEALRPVTQQYSLTRMELDILLFLANNPAYDTARDIVRVRLLSKSQVSTSLEALTKRGWLAARLEQDNRKVVHLSLLPDAHPAVEAGRRAQDSFFAVLFRDISADDLCVFERTTRRIAANIREHFAEEEATC